MSFTRYSSNHVNSHVISQLWVAKLIRDVLESLALPLVWQQSHSLHTFIVLAGDVFKLQMFYPL